MAQDYTHLPPPVRLEETIAEIDARTVQDPEAGQNVDRQLALHAGG